MASVDRRDLACGRMGGEVARRSLLDRLADRAHVQFHDRSFRASRLAAEFRCAAWRGFTGRCYQDAVVLPAGTPSVDARVPGRVLGHARDDGWTSPLRRDDDLLYPGWAATRGTRSQGGVRRT